MVVVVILNVFFIWFLIFFLPPAQCLVIVHLKWEFREGLQNFPLWSRDAHYALSTRLFWFFPSYFIFSIPVAVFRQLYFVMKNMDKSNSNMSPNCCAGKPDKWVHSYFYTWQPNCFLPSKFTACKVLMGWILFQPFANQQHLSKVVPQLYLLWWLGIKNRQAISYQCCQHCTPWAEPCVSPWRIHLLLL